MAKHVHAEVIKAWADGAEIEYKYNGSVWYSLGNESPTWAVLVQYRVKPKQYERWFNIYPKQDTGFLSKEQADQFSEPPFRLPHSPKRIACVKVVFTEGEGLV